MNMPLAGGLAFGLGGVARLIDLGLAMTHKPGGNWLAGAVGAGAVVLGFQILEDARPEWKLPVLYVVNAVALGIAIVCAYRFHRLQPPEPPGDGTMVRRWFVR
ncbi:MAG: hypothetical protein SFX73_15105 [Kofleriaceae bacterium]|nr:hypothetical protein [Kofleriaceae bacterium]